MKKKNWIQSMTVLGIAAAIPMMSTSVAFAGTSFDAHYQSNASQEASLLATAENAGVYSTNATYLKNEVNNLNTEIGALYSNEQTLANTTINIPQVNQDTLQQQIDQLKQQRQQLLEDSKNEWGQVNRFFHRKDPKSRHMFAHAKGNWEAIGDKLKDVDKQLDHLLKKDDDDQKPAPYHDGLTSLQNSILNLQTAVIDYTKEWISLEQNGTTTSTISAPTGLSISNLTDTGWTVSWNGVSNASSYDVYLNGNEVATGITGNSYTFSNEASNTNYNVTITAVDGSGRQSVPSNPVALTTTSSMSLNVSNITRSGWTLNWSSVSGAHDYVIYIGNTPIVSNVQSTSYTLSGEQANTSYAVSVRAYNATGGEIARTTATTVTTLS